MKTLFIIVITAFICKAQTIEEKLDRLFQDGLDKKAFSGSILICNNEGIMYKKSFGMSDYNKSIPVNNTTKFNIGSIGKFFTQIIIARLIQEGKLNVNDNLSKYLKVTDKADVITIKHLLTMSAGFGDYFQIPEFNRNPDVYRKIMDLTSLISKQPLLFEPGTSNRYSNSGYVILGAVIEKITGKSYEEILYELILKPLEMNNSGFIYKDSKAENQAYNHTVTSAGKFNNIYMNTPSVPTSAGGMFSTVEDIYKLDRSLLFDNRILDDKHKVLLLNRFKEVEGMTWEKLKNSPDFGFGVAGGSPGWNSIFLQNVNNKYSIIILSNLNHAAEYIEPGVVAILNGKEPPVLMEPINIFIYNYIRNNGINNFSENYETIFKENGYEIEGDGFLNRMGYELMNEGLLDEAIAVFEVNTKLFPDIPNVYDSLGEAYLKKGDKEKALSNYKKVLQMDPDNENAARILKDIK